MTPSQLEHLRKIDANLARLLDIAEKRTPGEWQIGNPAKYGTYNANRVNAGEDSVCEVYGIPLHSSLEEIREEPRWQKGLSNAAFIASCAGNAEAGWKATRAAIAWLERRGDMFGLVESEQSLLDSILTAFPLESLK